MNVGKVIGGGYYLLSKDAESRWYVIYGPRRKDGELVSFDIVSQCDPTTHFPAAGNLAKVTASPAFKQGVFQRWEYLPYDADLEARIATVKQQWIAAGRSWPQEP